MLSKYQGDNKTVNVKSFISFGIFLRFCFLDVLLERV